MTVRFRLRWTIVARSVLTLCGLSMACSRPDSIVVTPKAEPMPGRAQASRSSLQGPKPSAIYLKAEYTTGKACAPFDGGLAMYQTHSFRILEAFHTSGAIRQELRKTPLKVRLGDRPQSAPVGHQDGGVYTLRWCPSDKSWSQFCESDHINVIGEELEFVKSIPE
jgi:hypothetical protein